MKCLDVGPKEKVAIHNTLTRLAHTDPGKCLTPNIESLGIDCLACETNFLDNLFFVGPNLRYFAVDFTDNASQFYDLFNFFLPRTSKIVSLIIQSNLKDSILPFQEHFVSALRGLESLEEFTSGGFYYSPELFLALASLPNLKKLDHEEWITIPYWRPDQNIMDVINGIQEPFPHLQEINFFLPCTTINNLVSMNIRLPKVQKVSIRHTGGIIEDTMRYSFERISSDWSNLSELNLHFFGDNNLAILQISTFMELSSLCRMKVFEMSLRHPLKIEDSDLDRFIQDWKDLSEFSLTCNYDQERSQLTLSALTSFATHCRHIKHISIEVDATQNIEVPLGIQALNHLKNIDFLSSPIIDPNIVVVVLGQLCPFSVEITNNISRNSKGYNRWMKVSRALKLFNEVMDRRAKQNAEK